ncbi:DUF3137 domain-containing protein [Paremcibacter congregatus]|uniref:Galanin n=1 Tax=Paremcibacter congregatus TaxID=2043170 RepID=A0A2G4YVV7_9PROT|nr:DUF3137 domain-containing protein [Paremcibacter congregatus]PHZ86471.1 hypothetical protein CRD36_00865 [Paremcibacter congregatus]QDE28433.1 DUF3137 domain-containing protein [Paremcibacter congregatus]
MSDYRKRADEISTGSLEGALAGLDGFDRHFETVLKPALEKLEADRPKAVKRFFMVAGVAAVLFILGTGFILATQATEPQMVIFVGIGCIFIGYWGYRPLAALKTRTKMVVMHHLCDYLGMTYRLKPLNVSLTRLRELSLIPSYDESKLEDQITGAVDEVGFDLFEAKLIKISHDSKGRRRKSTVFRGLLAEFDFHKNFAGTTIITRDYSAFGNFFGQWGKQGERVALEDPTFESLFEVYATDQVEARYLLTPTFMERLCRLSGQVGRGNLQLAFHRGHLLLAIKKDKNSFEAGSVFANLADTKHIQQTIQELALIYDIVQKLKLDMDSRV